MLAEVLLSINLLDWKTLILRTDNRLLWFLLAFLLTFQLFLQILIEKSVVLVIADCLVHILLQLQKVVLFVQITQTVSLVLTLPLL